MYFPIAGNRSYSHSPRLLRLAIAAAAVFSVAGANAADQYAGLEEVVVTAEKRASTVQDTAIAVSAFDAAALEDRQIATTSDLQFSVPNMLFTKGNFTGSNIAIRGVGNSAVAASSDAGVGVHINDVYLNAPRIFEAEFYDMERLEVLRGPQGTLYGRNTTAGVVNLITAKPDSELAANFNIEVGDYNSRKFNGMINVPVTDAIATRLAVHTLKRDGYTDNDYTGNDIDDRDLWSARWTTNFDFTDRTSASFMVSYFEEDDKRSRVTKQLCTKDTRGAQGLGCSPDSKGFSTPDDQATIGTALTDLLTAQAIYQENVFGSTALPKFSNNVGLDSGALLTFQNSIRGILKPSLLAAGVPDAVIESQFDSFVANGFSGLAQDSFENSVNPTDLRTVVADFDPEYYTDELITTLEFTHDFDQYSLTAITSYHEVEYEAKTDYDWAVPSVNMNTPVTYLAEDTPITTNFAQGVDRSQADTEQWSQQFRLSSDFDGDFNFIAGAYYMNFESEGHYNVYSSGLSAYAAAGGLASIVETLFGVPAAALPAEQSFYDSHTIYEVTTWALFGEGYYNLSDETKITLGLRYSDETKEVQSRLLYVDLARSVTDPFSDQEEDWQEVTGKLGIDHYADLSFTDETLLYATIARGYKGGGFNPPATTPGAYSETFEPEYINSLELGAKSRLLDNRLQANLSFFYYDYSNLQISQIVNQAGINENVDATVSGLEAEFMYAPTPNWLFSLNVAYLDTEIGDALSVDSANPAQGGPVINVFGNLVPLGVAGAIPATQVDLDGNDLPNSPEYSVNAFAEYTQEISNGMTIVYHADYFWQDEYYTRNFNTAADEVDSWSVSNASITLNAADYSWHVKLWAKNLQDDDNITGHYTTDAVSGLFTNVFVLEPRTYGLTFGMEM